MAAAAARHLQAYINIARLPLGPLRQVLLIPIQDPLPAVAARLATPRSCRDKWQPLIPIQDALLIAPHLTHPLCRTTGHPRALPARPRALPARPMAAGHAGRVSLRAPHDSLQMHKFNRILCSVRATPPSGRLMCTPPTIVHAGP